MSDELRGRTFATLYTVVRLCLLISLTISPLWSDFWDWVSERLLTNQAVTIGPYTYALPGVRIALWGGGLITLVAGFAAWRSIRRAEHAERGEHADHAEHPEGGAIPIRSWRRRHPSPAPNANREPGSQSRRSPEQRTRE